MSVSSRTRSKHPLGSNQGEDQSDPDQALPALKRNKSSPKVWKVHFGERTESFLLYGNDVEAFKTQVRATFGLGTSDPVDLQNDEGVVVVITDEVPNMTSFFLPKPSRGMADADMDTHDAFLYQDLKLCDSHGVNYHGGNRITVFENLASCTFRSAFRLKPGDGPRHFELLIEPLTCCCFAGLVLDDFPASQVGAFLAHQFSGLNLASTSNHPEKVIFDFFFYDHEEVCAVYYRVNKYAEPRKLAWVVKISNLTRIAVRQVKHKCRFTLDERPQGYTVFPPLPTSPWVDLSRASADFLQTRQQ